jgi:hypothetical protein
MMLTVGSLVWFTIKARPGEFKGTVAYIEDFEKNRLGDRCGEECVEIWGYCSSSRAEDRDGSNRTKYTFDIATTV